MVKNEIDCIVWLRLLKDYFKTERDWYLAAAYIAPENSPVHNMYNTDLFTTIEDDIAQFANEGNVLLLGDFNSRIGEKSDFIENERITVQDMNIELNDKPTKRLTMDKTCNRFGEYLLELCKATNMCVVNWRSGCHDDNGCFTCYTHNGESLIDYVITNYSLMKNIRNFKVHGYKEYSNHAPISFGLCIQTQVQENDECDREFYKWSAKHKSDFLSDISNDVDALMESLQTVRQNETSVEDGVTKLVDFITSRADKLSQTK